MNGAQFTILLRALGAGQVGSEFSKVQAVISKLNAVLGALGVTLSAGALARATQQAINTADAAGKLAQKVGVAVDQLSKLSVAAKLNDLSMQQLAEGLKNMSRYLVESGQGDKSPEQALTDLADTFQKMPDGMQKTALAMKVFGRAGIEMIPLLNQGKSGIEGMMREAEELGVVVGPRFAANAETFNDNLARMKFLVEGVFLRFADTILPDLVKFSELLLDLAKAFEGHTKLVNAMTLAYQVWATQVALVWNALSMIAGKSPQEALDNFKKRLEEIVSLTQKINAPARSPAGAGSGTSPDRGTFDATRKRIDLAIEELKIQAREVELNKGLTPVERQRELNRLLGEEISLIAQRRSLTSEAFSDRLISRDEKASFDLQDRAGIAGAMGGMGDVTVGQHLQRNLESLVQSWGTVASNIAGTITGTIGTAIESLSEGIQGLIKGTVTWGQALARIGTSIMDSVIKAIGDLFARWIVGRLAVKAVEITASAAEAAAKLPAALMTSISSYGLAALIGAGALAAVMAAMGAFERGGYTGAGDQSAPAGIVHRGEFVMSAPAVQRIGLSNLEALHSGAPMPAAGPQVSQSFAVLTDDSQLPNWTRTAQGEAYVIDTVRRNLHRL